VNLTEIRVFLVLAEELHFGRTAERVYLSQPQVSRLMAALERRVGGRLVDRTSRSVRLTPLGQRLRSQLEPTYRQLYEAVAHAREYAQGISGKLRVGYTGATGGVAVTRLINHFETQHPECLVELGEQPYAFEAALDTGQVDVMVNWLANGRREFTLGPAIDVNERVLGVATNHPLAGRSQVDVEDLADCVMVDFITPMPNNFVDMINPKVTPSGRPIPRGPRSTTLNETLDLVARGRVVHPTMSTVAVAHHHRYDITWIPISGLPSLPLGLIWFTAHENARTRALAETARRIGPLAYE
jgi:DNA-binding transcriptional LysR family regulator